MQRMDAGQPLRVEDAVAGEVEVLEQRPQGRGVERFPQGFMLRQLVFVEDRVVAPQPPPQFGLPAGDRSRRPPRAAEGVVAVADIAGEEFVRALAAEDDGYAVLAGGGGQRQRCRVV